MTVLYFTATGNSLYVARRFEGKNVSIPQAIKNNLYEFTDDIIGIVYPAFGHEMPPIVQRFLQKATLDAEYKFCILTYGRRNGGAAELAEKFFASCGIRMDYIDIVLMADNFLPVFDMDEERTLDKKVDEQLSAIVQKVDQRVKYIRPSSAEDVAAHKQFISMKSKNPDDYNGSQLLITDKCVGCGICLKVCPVGNIYLENGVAKRKNEQCEFCLSCAHNCTVKAITCRNSDKNPNARYRNENICLCEIVKANNQN